MAKLQNSALIIVDLQEDFCPPSGALAVTNGRDVVNVINDLLEYPGFCLRVATADTHPENHISFARLHDGAKAFETEHTIRNPENGEETQTTLLWPDHCVVGSKGVELIPELRKERIDTVVKKGTDARVEAYSAFGPPFRSPRIAMSSLHGVLEEAGVKDVFVVGLAFDYCVKATALDAAELGYRTYVIGEGTKAVFQDESALRKTKEELEAGGVRVIGLDSEEVRQLKQ